MSKRLIRKLNTPALQVTAAVVGLMVIAGLTFVSVVYQRDIARAFTLATSHQPERYSELYFQNSAHLPLYSLSGKVQHVAFHITNHEARPTTYHYLVTMTAAGKTTTLADQAVTLQDGQGMSVPFTYIIQKPSLAAQIAVQLDGRTEHIGFGSKS